MHTFLSGFWISGNTAQNGFITSRNLTENKKTRVCVSELGMIAGCQWDVAVSGGRIQDILEFTITKFDVK